ncbi:MAG TPA: hypothetical protein VG892_06710, partial [Terriglobales bacterium]|nr:hypothetical protein [Terriglobales bacterium]
MELRLKSERDNLPAPEKTSPPKHRRGTVIPWGEIHRSNSITGPNPNRTSLPFINRLLVSGVKNGS